MAIASILGAMTITVMLVIQGLMYSMGSSPAPLLPYMAISVALLLFVIYTHRSNITRILSGSEMKV
jgi:glycerol-3-phosphate acyltransferase PlsY